ncbi:hypothetical protein N9164_02745 [Draconibacterium sp.]|nr:hypothetical protein [Draconibacterium sp.]
MRVDLHSSFSIYTRKDKKDIKSETEFPFAAVTTHTAEKVYKKILDYCGASLSRDSDDIRILHDRNTITARFINVATAVKME